MDEGNELYTYLSFLGIVVAFGVFALLIANSDVNAPTSGDVAGDAIRSQPTGCCNSDNMGKCIANNYRCHSSIPCEIRYDSSCQVHQVYYVR